MEKTIHTNIKTWDLVTELVKKTGLTKVQILEKAVTAYSSKFKNVKAVAKKPAPKKAEAKITVKKPASKTSKVTSKTTSKPSKKKLVKKSK